MKKFMPIVGLVVTLLAFTAFIASNMDAQVKLKKQERLQKTRKLQTAKIMGPVIKMKRTTLESAKNMKVYKIKTLTVSPTLLKNLSEKHSLQLRTEKPTGRTPQKLKLYRDKKEDFTRLIVNETRGHINLLTDIKKIEKMKVTLLRKDAALTKAASYIKGLNLIPKDDSQFAAKKVITLGSAELKYGQHNSSTEILQTVLFDRTLDSKAVMGKGSQISVDLGSNGSIEGFQRNWNQLTPTTTRGQLRTSQEVFDKIESILKSEIKGNVEVQVDTPRLVYFGDDRQYVQPVYFFSAKISPANSEAVSYYSGVVEALKNPPEPAMLTKKITTANSPTIPLSTMKKLKVKSPPPPPGDPIIGRYVQRWDSEHWVHDANDFRGGLDWGHVYCGGCAPLSYPQYYWSEVRLFTTQDNTFVDRCHVVLAEGHGNHWLFCTSGGARVFLNDASQPGYGGHGGGIMTYFILKSCSVIPAPPDRRTGEGTWDTPWWRIFKGLRQAVGFRTLMYINDDISDNFGYWIGKNCRVLDSWFYSTNTNSSYRWNRFWGASVTGYGAVVMIPGQEGAGIYHVSPVAPATSTGLRMYWQH
jgi:hypothetical protein